MNKEERGEKWKTVEHERAISMSREMIKTCASHRNEHPYKGCDRCADLENGICPARRYLETCKQPDAWECQ